MLLLLALACHRPPPAPEGLDDASRYLLREFYGDDETVGAGLTGLVDWYETDGVHLVGVEADQDNVDGFELADLQADDVAALGLPDDGRDLALAVGVVGVATVTCTVAEAEPLLVRADQDVVFDDFDAYERTYLSSRSTFESADGDVPPMDAVDPLADGFDPDATAASMLMTDNTATASALGVTMVYPLRRDLRHGTFDVGGTPTDAILALGWVPEATAAEDGGTTLEQNYGVEAYVDREGETLRIFAVWTAISSKLVPRDSPVWPTKTVNQTRDSAQRMTDLCDGTVEIPPEGS